MKIGVDIKNVDLGETRAVTDVAEQIALLSTALCHADKTEGWEVRALMVLSAAIALEHENDAENCKCGAQNCPDGLSGRALSALLGTAAALVVEKGHNTGTVLAYFNDAIGIATVGLTS